MSRPNLDAAARRLTRCLDLFDLIEPHLSFRPELLRACAVYPGDLRERCLTLLWGKIQRDQSEASNAAP